MRRLKPGNEGYNSGQNILFSSFISKNIKIKVYRTIILSVALYGCEAWLLRMREDHRLRVFENKVSRTTFGCKSNEVTENGENYTMKSLMNCALHQILFGLSNKE
jgi:hypothetical protein